MPGMLSSWQGPGSVSYAGSCLSNGVAVDAGVAAMGTAAATVRRFAAGVGLSRLYPTG
jgi:hypothetical protein